MCGQNLNAGSNDHGSNAPFSGLWLQGHGKFGLVQRGISPTCPWPSFFFDFLAFLLQFFRGVFLLAQGFWGLWRQEGQVWGRASVEGVLKKWRRRRAGKRSSQTRKWAATLGGSLVEYGTAFFRALRVQNSEPEIWSKSLFLLNFLDYLANFGLWESFRTWNLSLEVPRVRSNISRSKVQNTPETLRLRADSEIPGFVQLEIP